MKNVTALCATSVACALLPGLSSPAHAQSSVTLYGSLDAGVGYVSNLHGASAFIAEQGTLQADRFGFLGTEDLGAGRTALFRLESGFVTTTGASASSTSFFNRQAYVGLSDPLAGTLTLGRQTDWNFDWLGTVSTGQLLGNFSAFHPGNLDGLGSTLPVQLSSTIKWKSASFYGLTLGALYGFPGAAASNTSGRTISFGGNYTSGPLKLVAVWSEYNDRLLPLAGGLGLASFEGQTLPGGSSFAAPRVRDGGIGGSYRFGSVTIHALATDVRIASAGGASHFRTVDGGLNVHITPAEEVAAGAWSAWLDGKRWTQATIASVYSLSKSTQLYADVMFETAGGGAVADTLGIGASSNGNQVVVLSGIHHLF
ncbi:porin [Paraburkholderia ferrariae]|uniref:porin n=1 Tax=Paraburkholderia ferrariae TaxID=386056 RepID=UPI0005AA5BF3|nr:porin [Paraburkholderia ferrariae]